MGLGKEEEKKILAFVKKEPRTIQEISKVINRSWVTTDSYVKKLKESTGLLDIKIFRPGTQAALKIVFYNAHNDASKDEIEELLHDQIKNGRTKYDFDFLEIFKFVPDKDKRAFLISPKKKTSAADMIPLFRRAKSQIYYFSGNLSFMNKIENGEKLLDVIEETVARGVSIKILCRIDAASLSNIKKMEYLIRKYPGFVEIKHCFQPLRGIIIDDDFVRFKDEKKKSTYKEGELEEDLHIYYEIKNAEWINWLQKVFWKMFRSTIDYSIMEKELEKIF